MSTGGLRFVAVLLVAVATTAPGAQAVAQPAPSPTPEQLESEKLQAEIRKLELESKNLSGWRGRAAAYAPLAGVLTAIVALIGVFVTLRNGRREQRRQQDLDRAQREREQEQRENESLRRLDERFTAVLTDLGSTSEAVQAGAAVSLLTFLRPEHRAFHRQVRLVTLANLKVTHAGSVAKLLVRVFEAAVRTEEPLEPLERDLSRAELARVDLSGLDLSEADLAFATLRGANLKDATLWRARGHSVDLRGALLSGEHADLREIRFREAKCSDAQFHDANLRAAHLEAADLSRAEFQRARLQSAHFDEATLTGAKFEQADLNDAYFREATLDEAALRSIRRALNWQKAHFSPVDQARLDALSPPTVAPTTETEET